ncbi:ribonuclease P protein component [Flammeovirga sp. MY04]|uniref:ribonuclease P protein component n=1 Tax=Flammeovirga sp. MY04 TaxID=1191459 RepID=UPI000806096C|nr:ribonuclease P protein component [Flammeovirga sp. MY04]ANQ50838.1 ribonuclease P protein component [Flammeovirga sp. MY04]
MEKKNLPTYDRATFPKSEHLKSRSQIEQMFKDGQSVFCFPFKIYYSLSSDVENASIPPQVLFSVSKRGFKHAVDRNRIKRQLREVYRLNKGILNIDSPLDKVENLAFVYVSRKKEPHAFLERKMKASLYKVNEVRQQPSTSEDNE